MVSTKLVMIPRREFLNLMETEPKLATHMLKLVCARIRWTSELVEDSAFLSVPARLAKRLLGLEHLRQDDDPTKKVVTISQAALGELSGISRETVNRHLQSWRKSGWILLKRGKVLINDRAALQNVVSKDTG